MTMFTRTYRNTLRSAFLALAALLAVLGAIALTGQPHAAHAAPLHAYTECAQTRMIELYDTGYTRPDAYGVQIKVGLNVKADINSTRDNIYYCGAMRGITKIIQECTTAPVEDIGTGMHQWDLHHPGTFYPWGSGFGTSVQCTSDTQNPQWSDTGWVTAPESAVYCANWTWDAFGEAENVVGGSYARTQKWCY